MGQIALQKTVVLRFRPSPQPPSLGAAHPGRGSTDSHPLSIEKTGAGMGGGINHR
jgi:hypothetical protein